MRLSDILFFLAFHQEIPLGEARSFNSRKHFATARETYDEIVNDLEIVNEPFFKNDNDTKNEIEYNFIVSQLSDWMRNFTIEYVNLYDDDVNLHRGEIKLEDIRWNQSKLRGTDVWVFVPYFTLFQSANQVNIMFLEFLLLNRVDTH